MIKVCEEIMLNSDPSFADRFENNFLVRFLTNQYRCIIYAIGDKRNSLAERIQYIERLLKEKGENPNYRILYTEEYRRLDEELFKMGYEKVEEGTVKYMDIGKIQKELFTFASFLQNGVFIEPKLERFWIEQYREFRGLGEMQKEVFIDNMKRSREEFCFFTLMEENKMIGQSYASMDKGIFHICDVVMDPRYRNLAYGKRLIMSMLSYAYKNDIEHVIAPVEMDNEPANRLFADIGFEDAYHYWRRIKNIVDK